MGGARLTPIPGYLVPAAVVLCGGAVVLQDFGIRLSLMPCRFSCHSPSFRKHLKTEKIVPVLPPPQKSRAEEDLRPGEHSGLPVVDSQFTEAARLNHLDSQPPGGKLTGLGH